MPTKRPTFEIGEAVTVSATVYHYVNDERIVVKCDGQGENDFRLNNVPVKSLARPVCAFHGKAPQIRVKSFRPAKYRYLAEEALAAGHGAAEALGENNLCGELGEVCERVREALRPELLLAILPPARHGDYLELLARHLEALVCDRVQDPESGILGKAELTELHAKDTRAFGKWMDSFSCTLEAVPAEVSK